MRKPKTIICTKEQLEEALNDAFVYLDDEDDYNEFDGETQTSVVSNKTDGKPGVPPDTDEFANTQTPGWYYGFRTPMTRAAFVNGKVNVNEENSQLKNRTFYIPDDLYMNLQNTLNQKADKTTTPGYKRLKNLLNNRHVSYSDMKRIKNFFDHFNGDVESDEYVMNGGKRMCDWVNSSLGTARDAVYGFKDAKRKMGMNNAFIRPHEKDANNKNVGKPTMPKVDNSSKSLENGKTVHYE